MASKIYSACLHGLDAIITEIEVDVSSGLPSTSIVGLVDTSVKEARQRVRACIRNSKLFKYPISRITINLAPADTYKYGTQFDFGIALAILVASGQIDFDFTDSIFLGELSLNSRLRKINGCIAMILQAKGKGFRRVFLPEDNLAEAKIIDGIEIVPVRDFEDFMSIVNGKYLPLVKSSHKIFFSEHNTIDFSEVYGQIFAKRALEIVAAGGHNVLLSGSPGSGKTMLAQALPSILPVPSNEQMLEILKIHSAVGLVGKEFYCIPFRNPHQGISYAAFIGGGNFPKPGELSLAHNGVLFMDEFPEFSRAIIEALRQPLEVGSVSISRLQNYYNFPARFIFIAAQNRCPCGYYQDPEHECTCTMSQIQRYQHQISGPVLDRIDLQIQVSKVKAKQLFTQESENSVAIKKRVELARQKQYRRYRKKLLNAHLQRKEILKYCAMDSLSRKLLYEAEEKYDFSNRTYFKLIKVARTIADLAGQENILQEHVAEALRYRLQE